MQDYCRAKLGKLDSTIRLRSFEEVKAHNAAGQCWLTLDGEHNCLSRLFLCHIVIRTLLFFA